MIANRILDIRQIRTIEELQAVERAAKADDHNVIRPGVAFLRDGVPIGYAGIATVPCVTFWLDTKRATVIDSMTAHSFIEGKLHTEGVDLFLMPIEEKSPYFRLMEQVGYVKTNYTHLFMKGLR
jgi:hypothetical protein